MKDLFEYIKESIDIQPVLDGHQHVFSHRGVQNNLILDCKSRVGMIDIEFDCLDQYKDIPQLYKKFMPECTNVRFWLASGLNIDDIKKVYEQNDNIAGFGELKLYNSFRGKEINFKKISFARQVCSFSKQVGCLPVYIHYELEEPRERKALENLIKDYPEIPIVLSHCCMNEHNQLFAWAACTSLSRRYSNVYLNVSWDGAKWLAQNPQLLMQAPRDRIFWGSDLSPRLIEHGFKTHTMEEIESWGRALLPYMNSDQVLYNLFAHK